MFASERYDIIIGLIDRHRSVTVTELCERFGVSIETVRRDLAYLEKNRKLKRVHGGAVSLSANNIEFASLSVRIDDNIDKKRELSEYAMDFISEGDVIALDSGSTATEFTSVLCEHFKNLTIVTFSMDVVQIASERSNFRIVCLGGTYLAEERLFHGYMAEEAASGLHTDKCIIFPSSLSYNFGAMTALEEAVGVEKALIRASDKVYILADSSKFEANSPIRLMDLTDADAVITDSCLDERISGLYRENGINLINRGAHNHENKQ